MEEGWRNTRGSLSIPRPAERRGGSGHPSPKRDGAELLSDVLMPWIAAGKEARPVLGTEQDADQ